MLCQRNNRPVIPNGTNLYGFTILQFFFLEGGGGGGGGGKGEREMEIT